MRVGVVARRASAARGSSRSAIWLADDRISSIGALNQRSTLVRISSLPTMQHEHRRHERHAEQQRDQLGAEPRERQRPPPLDDQLDDVARQHEDQRASIVRSAADSA